MTQGKHPVVPQDSQYYCILTCYMATLFVCQLSQSKQQDLSLLSIDMWNIDFIEQEISGMTLPTERGLTQGSFYTVYLTRTFDHEISSSTVVQNSYSKYSSALFVFVTDCNILFAHCWLLFQQVFSERFSDLYMMVHMCLRFWYNIACSNCNILKFYSADIIIKY